MWQQNYEPVGGSLALSALVAAIPIVVLFVMLGVRRKPAWMAALTALAIAFVLALFAYGMPVQLALMSALTGAAYGVFPIALPLAYLMNYSGMTSTLGIALAATGSTFPFFSAILGWLGVFLTGSDTSANALFGNLQMITANQIGLNPVLTASVNSAAGVMGKMIALPSIAVAVAATGLTPEDEGKLFRFTLTHSIFLARVVGIVAMLFGYVFPSMVPVLP
jgi:L-lactate permease